MEPGNILAAGTNHRGLNSFMDGEIVRCWARGFFGCACLFNGNLSARGVAELVISLQLGRKMEYRCLLLSKSAGIRVSLDVLD